MRGVITRTDVLRNLGLIWREFGAFCLCRCLRAALTARQTTFLEVAMRPRRLPQQDQRVAVQAAVRRNLAWGCVSGRVIALVFGLFVASAALMSCGGGVGEGSGSGSGSIISALTASPSQVNYGETTTLSWTLGGVATSLTLDGESVLGESSRRVSPARRQSYELAASNSFSAETRSVTVAARGLDLLAGTLGGAGNLDGIGSAARFNNPVGVAVDGAGNVYVADTFNHTIRKVTAAGVVSTLAGLAGVAGSADGISSTARFNYPHGVAVDGASNVYVADSQNHTIRKVTAAGVVTTLAGLAGMAGSADGIGSTARFNYPHGVAVDGAGNVYVADSGNHTIRKVTAVGVTTLAGSAGTPGSADGAGSAARFRGPGGVAVDGAGNVYVADTNNYTIRKVTAAGEVSTLAGLALAYGSADGTGSAARFDSPNGVAADGSGNVYVADTFNSTIRKITAAKVVSTVAGSVHTVGSADGTGSAARFASTNGVAVDGAGNVYVADGGGNNTIRKVTTVGVVSTPAGLAGMAGSADGTGSAARFYNPRGLAVDGSGNVYVADRENHTIRKVTTARAVSTLAGSAGMVGSADGAGMAARFNYPNGVAVTGSGDVYVADSENHTLRKITADGRVSTLAGSAGMAGSADGVGNAARFNNPYGVAVDGAGNVYVADSVNHTIRKITAAGVVSTLAGSAGMAGSADGAGVAARFRRPNGVAADGSGNVYVADSSNHTIRKVSAAGVVTTIAGSVGSRGATPGFLPATLVSPRGIALTPDGDLIVSSSNGVVQITAF